MPNELELDDRALQASLLVLSQATAPVTAAVITKDEKVKKYWPILEAGSTPGNKPWPTARKKTVQAEGGRIFSKQAPRGFVKINANLFIAYLVAEVAAGPELPSQKEMQGMVNRAAAKVFSILHASIPVDKGRARDSLDIQEGR